MKIKTTDTSPTDTKKLGYILQCKALDGRYNRCVFTLHNEGNFSPIYAQDSFNRYPKGRFLRDAYGEQVVQWIGGRYPSGHVEVYEPQHPEKWRDQTLPISLEQADKLAKIRQKRVSTTAGMPNFQYRIVTVTHRAKGKLSNSLILNRGANK